MGGVPADFGQVWFGAASLLKGENPYPIMGPGKEYVYDFQFLYPLTASVAVLPLGLLPERLATLVFVWLSCGILAYSVTRHGWYRLPIFLSSAFVVAARRGQWSPLLTAAYCLPWMGWVLAAKPNIGLAVLSGLSSIRSVKIALAGGTLLALVALAIVPTWIGDWLATLSNADHTSAPVMARGGVFILLALLRWRRPEARLLLVMACIPHSMDWYEVLPLMLIPANFRETVAFVLVSTTGLAFEQLLILREVDQLALYRNFNALIVAVAYLPATIMILGRPNEIADRRSRAAVALPGVHWVV